MDGSHNGNVSESCHDWFVGMFSGDRTCREHVNVTPAWNVPLTLCNEARLHYKRSVCILWTRNPAPFLFAAELYVFVLCKNTNARHKNVFMHMCYFVSCVADSLRCIQEHIVNAAFELLWIKFSLQREVKDPAGSEDKLYLKYTIIMLLTRRRT